MLISYDDLCLRHMDWMNVRLKKLVCQILGFYNSDQNNYIVLRLWLVQDLKPLLDSSVTIVYS